MIFIIDGSNHRYVDPTVGYPILKMHRAYGKIDFYVIKFKNIH